MDNPDYRGPPRGLRDVQVRPEEWPGCVSGADRSPTVGERVFTREGAGVVTREVGRTEKGGMLLELSMDDGREQPFFVAAHNVMVAISGDGVSGHALGKPDLEA